MAKSAYRYMSELWKRPKDGEMRELIHQRLIKWRRQPVVNRVERPTRPDRARQAGYKAKQGVIVARTRVRRGGLRKERHSRGRVPSKAGVNKITMAKSTQRIAEERTSKKFPNLEVLNSYKVTDDGRHHYYEVILLDPEHPAIQNDPDLGWIAEPGHKDRAQRGLTAAGKKGRGLNKKGKGAEKIRPSIRSHDSKGK